MTEIEAGAQASATAACTEQLALRAPHPEGGEVAFRVARPDEIAALHALTVREIGEKVASLEAMARVQRHDPESFWTVLRSCGDSDPFRIVGYYGYLYLSPAGLAQLEARSFDGLEPDLTLLAKPHERPAAIYIWAMVARRLTTILGPLVAQAFPKWRYGGVPIFAKAGTVGGLKSLATSAAHQGNEDAHDLGDVFRIDIKRTAAAAERIVS